MSDECSHETTEEAGCYWLRCSDCGKFIVRSVAERKAAAAEITRLTAALAAAEYESRNWCDNAHREAERAKKAEAALSLYREAVIIGVRMEGPQFIGSNMSALRRAWDEDRATMKEEKPNVG